LSHGRSKQHQRSTNEIRLRRFERDVMQDACRLPSDIRLEFPDPCTQWGI